MLSLVVPEVFLHPPESTDLKLVLLLQIAIARLDWSMHAKPHQNHHKNQKEKKKEEEKIQRNFFLKKIPSKYKHTAAGVGWSAPTTGNC